MKAFFITSLLAYASIPSGAIELVCRDRQPQDPQQRTVFAERANAAPMSLASK
jgi:hypothetical protein